MTICLIGLSGCAHTHAVGADRVLHIALSEYRLNPQQINAKEGALMVVVRNFGRLTHNLVVTQNGQTTATTTPLLPGQSTELYLDLNPGTYSIASTILSDQDLGAHGTLTVTR